MASKEKKFTPIHEVVSPIVQVNLPLPASLADRIGMNVGRMENICHWIGINKLAIVGTNDFQPQEGMPNIGSVSINGEAGAIGYAEAEKDDVIDIQPSNGRVSYRKCNVSLSTNLRDIERKIINRNEAVIDPVIWAQSLDSKIRRELVRSAFHHMIKNTGRKELYELSGPLIYTSIIATELSKMVTQSSSDIGAASLFAGIWGFMTAVDHILNKFNDSNATFSILPDAVQLDRFGVAVAKTVNPITNLVKAIS